MSILQTGKIWGSDSGKGFIKGPHKAACFMDVPFASLKYVLTPENSDPQNPRYEACGNDPYGQHDFGAFDHEGQRIFWKIDYYAPDMETGSENPADVSKTFRVLTILLASEW